MTVRETVDAGKTRFGERDVLALFEGASKVVVAKGKKLVELDLAKDPAAKAQLTELALGPTGNLRAPTIRLGTTWLVGFHEEAYAARLD